MNETYKLQSHTIPVYHYTRWDAMETLYTQDVVERFGSIDEIISDIQRKPKKKRYNLSLSYCTEEDLHEILQLGRLLKCIGSGINILINAYTSPMAIDFLTTELRETEHSIYISNRF